MAKNAPLTEDEAQELFSELDDSGVIDPLLAHRRVRGGDAAKADDEARREDVQVGLNLRRARRAKVDPLSEQDPSGSKAGEAISRTAILCIAVLTAICFCWSGFLSTHVPMLDDLKGTEFTGFAIVTHLVGGLAAGVLANVICMLIGIA